MLRKNCVSFDAKVIVRFTDGRPAAIYEGELEDVLFVFIMNKEFRWCKGFDYYIGGVKVCSWILKRG